MNPVHYQLNVIIPHEETENLMNIFQRDGEDFARLSLDYESALNKVKDYRPDGINHRIYMGSRFSGDGELMIASWETLEDSHTTIVCDHD